MRIPRIYLPQPLSAEAVLKLPPEAARHVNKVLRLKQGDRLRLFNGEGGQWLAQLEIQTDGLFARLESFEVGLPESPLDVTLVQAVGRGERMDYAVQKAVELGVSAIQPLFTERTVVKLQGERLERRMQHWRAVMIAACEQCGRCVVPDLLPAVFLPQALGCDAEAKWVLAPSAKAALNIATEPRSVALMIGPEGGLSESELAAADAAGWQPWQLGPRVLRTETAASAALAVLQARWGDFGSS